MPSRNILRVDSPDSFYHVYARGASKQAIFLDPADYQFFINLFARYLSQKPSLSNSGIQYPHFAGHLELLAYCLMRNHFHLLIYQHEQGSLAACMRSLMTSYSRYFNSKYKRTGSLFESRYKASRIDADNYLQHISRYIHLNPRYWQRYPYSSFQFYVDSSAPEWLTVGKVMELFESQAEYVTFIKDYEGQKAILEELKFELADY